ncbi:hypothetical protein E2C01_093173 [Portunus trituberculatus]|uniref:Uncharacterized protein n=1 Tax=Portunus trituberculatus TaxID=210409 RepID=A0A5B7JXF5_PORTR|nr:hypothetical protein [Portunus trituberculatus]
MCTAHPVVYTQAQTLRVTTAIHGVQILVKDKSGGRQLRTNGQHEASQLFTSVRGCNHYNTVYY